MMKDAFLYFGKIKGKIKEKLKFLLFFFFFNSEESRYSKLKFYQDIEILGMY